LEADGALSAAGALSRRDLHLQRGPFLQGQAGGVQAQDVLAAEQLARLLIKIGQSLGRRCGSELAATHLGQLLQVVCVDVRPESNGKHRDAQRLGRRQRLGPR